MIDLAVRRYHTYERIGDTLPCCNPRIMFTSCLRFRTNQSRIRYMNSAVCCSGDFTDTNRMVGRVAASQIA
jgi:hypothetical protein